VTSPRGRSAHVAASVATAPAVACIGPCGALKAHTRGESVRRRDGRCPVGAPTVAVGLAGRLRCDARSAVAPRNSLHSLRSLRSNSLGESDERSALRAPTALLRFSPPHKSPPPGTAHRAAALVAFGDGGRGGAGKAGGGCAPAATYAAPRSAGLVAARVSALRVPTRRDCSSGVSAASEASFATATRPSTAGNPSRSEGLPHPSAGAHPTAALPR
jgi:hypothetical protein